MAAKWHTHGQPLTVIAGNRVVLAGRMLGRIGESKERVEKEIAGFEKACDAAQLATKPAAPSAAVTKAADAADTCSSA